MTSDQRQSKVYAEVENRKLRKENEEFRKANIGLAGLVGDMVVDLSTMVDDCMLPDGDHIDTSVHLWAENWLERIKNPADSRKEEG